MIPSPSSTSLCMQVPFAEVARDNPVASSPWPVTRIRTTSTQVDEHASGNPSDSKLVWSFCMVGESHTSSPKLCPVAFTSISSLAGNIPNSDKLCTMRYKGCIHDASRTIIRRPIHWEAAYHQHSVFAGGYFEDKAYAAVALHINPDLPTLTGGTGDASRISAPEAEDWIVDPPQPRKRHNVLSHSLIAPTRDGISSPGRMTYSDLMPLKHL